MTSRMIDIRRAAPPDAEALSAVGAATFLESYAGVVNGQAIIRHCAERHSPDVYARALASKDEALWLAELAPGAAPVGYLHITAPDLPVPTGPDDIEIKRIYALSRFHGTGLGRRLLEAGLDHARAAGKRVILLGVYRGNARALAFYGKMGFEAVGERQFDVGGTVYCDRVMAREV